MIESHPQKPNLCPACGYFSDRVGSLVPDAAPPREGDFTVCFGCGAINCFTATFGLIPALHSALAELRHSQPASYAVLREMSLLVVAIPRPAKPTHGA